MDDKIIKPIIILSGPIGAGKTTVAKEIIKSYSTPVVYIEGDQFWFFIARSDKSISRSKNFKTIMAAMMAAAVPYAMAGYEVILDFSMPPWFLDTARRIAGGRNIPLDYIVLQPGEEVCAARAASRTEGVIADYSLYHDLYLSFGEAGPNTVVDASNDISITTEKILKGLKEGAFRLK